jgi:hypothetical protein
VELTQLCGVDTIVRLEDFVIKSAGRNCHVRATGAAVGGW